MLRWTSLVILVLALTTPTIAEAGNRMYSVEPYRNCHTKAVGGINNGVAQTFVNCADSLAYIDWFVGAANSEGSYSFVIQTPAEQELYHGDAEAGGGIDYEFVRADLERSPGAPPLIKGKEYVLRITQTDPNESLDVYYSPWDPYPYGIISFPGGSFEPPPETYSPDICARIEGIKLPVSREEAELAELRKTLPDVAVDSFWLVPDQPRSGQPVGFGARVSSRGGDKAGAGVAVAFYASDDLVGSARSQKEIPAGSTQVFETGPAWTPVPGEYLLRAEVNPTRVIDESDFDNNCRFLYRQVR